MAQLTVADAGVNGAVITYVAAAGGGDKFANPDGATSLRVKNGSGVSINVTVNSQQQCSHGFDHDVIVAVAAGAEKVIGPFAKGRFNDVDGNVNVTYSAVTTVTVVPVRQLQA